MATVKAIYQNGVFRPIGKIRGLKEKQKVELVIKETATLTSLLKEGYRSVRRECKLINKEWDSMEIENWE